MCEIKKYRVGDLVINFDRKRKPLSGRQRENMKGIYPYYGAACIFDYINDYIFDGEYILLGEDGTVINSDGTPVLQRISGKTWVNNHAHVLKNSEIIDFDYLYYVLKNANFSGAVTGAVQPKISQANMNAVEVNIHTDLRDQIKVASILKSLDDKIELNNKINDNLLQQAQAIYDEICKDCEPIKLESLISVIETGSRPKGGAESEGIPSIGAEKIERFGTYDFSGEKYISEEFFSKLKRGIVLSGDVLLYKDGAYTGKSSMALDGFPHEKCAVNEHVFILRTRDNFAQYFLYFTLSSPSIREKIYTLACGKAAQPGLNQQELFSVEAPIPPDDVLQDFDKQVDPLMHAIALNALENLKLSNLRDSLLPKLMSGEIDVDSLDL